MSTDRITVDPARMAGTPTIRDTRVTVTAVLGQLAAGRTTDEILVDIRRHPRLRPRPRHRP